MRLFAIRNSQNVTIRNSVFDGGLAHGGSAVDNGFATGVGLLVQESVGVVIENNEIFEFHRGIVTGASSDLIMRGDNLHTLRSDGMNFAQVERVLMETIISMTSPHPQAPRITVI